MLERCCRLVLWLFALLGGLAAIGWIGQDWVRISLPAYAAPDWSAWAGANAIGQNLGQRWLQALASLWLLALPAALLALSLALLLAWLAAGDGWSGRAARLLIDLADAVPALLAVLALLLALRGWFAGMLVALAWCLWPESVRILEVELRRLRGQDLWRSMSLSGASAWRNLQVQLLPLLAPLLRDQLLLLFVLAVKTELVLSFVGLNQSASVSLGGMLAEGSIALSEGYWWPMLLPCFTLWCLVGAATVVRPRGFQLASRIE